MDFQITALPAQPFEHLFDLSDSALAQHQARRKVVIDGAGVPCRVGLR